MKTIPLVLFPILVLLVATPGAWAYFPHVVCSGDGIAVELSQSRFDQKTFNLDVYSDRENPNYQNVVPGSVDATIAELEDPDAAVGTGLLSAGEWETRQMKPIDPAAGVAAASYAFKLKRRVYSTVVSWEAFDESLVGRIVINEDDPAQSKLELGKRTWCKDSAFTIRTGFGGPDGPPDFLCWGWNVRTVSTGVTQPVSCKLAKSLDPSVWHSCPYNVWRGQNVCPSSDQGLWPRNRGIVGVRVADDRRADGAVVIAEVLPGTPADLAGLKAGDVVTALKAERTAPWISTARGFVAASVTAVDFSLLIQGAPGTPVVLRVSSGGSPERDVTIVRKGLGPSTGRSGD